MAASLEGAKVVVVGLGASGASAVRYLLARRAQVSLTDSREAPPQIADVQRMASMPCVLGRLGAPGPLSQYALAVLSPGVALTEPFVASLASAGVPLVGDIELFAREARAPVVGVTGTNGKSTVTTLIAEMAKRGSRPVAVGGNLGTPALDLLDAAVGLYVLELSSFQLETTHSLRPRVAVWLNFSEDHLDRHLTADAYAAAKARIFAGAQFAVVNREDPVVMARAPAHAITFGLDAPEEGHYGISLHGGEPWLVHGSTPLMPESALRIQGKHNAANALASLAAARAAGVTDAQALAALRDFTGLPHRCEWVTERDGVAWINDSKGTNVGATLAALKGLPGPIVWLGGGQGKGQDFAPLRAPLEQKAHVALVFGQDAQLLERTLSDVVRVIRVPDLAAAVHQARRLARPGDRVLLSPACASLDQFSNYAERGNVFRSLARESAA